MPAVADAPTPEPRIVQLEAELAAANARLTQAKSDYERLQRAYTHALEQLQLMRRRLFVATAERPPVAAEQLAFDVLFEEVKRLAKALDAADPARDEGDDDRKRKKPPATPKGRRNLENSTLPVERVEITDPELEGIAERVGVEESWRLAYERGRLVRVCLARVVYKQTAPAAAASTSPGASASTSAPSNEPPSPLAGETEATSTPDVAAPATPVAASASAKGVEPEPTSEAAQAEAQKETKPPPFVTTTAPLPKELVRRGLLAPSLIAHILVAKYVLGVPFYRLEQHLARQGASLDRGTMSRYAEDVGASLGAIVAAACVEAMGAACLSTDATGVSIQLGPLEERDRKARGPCRKGHFFVVLADNDHVFFEYQPKHTSAAVCAMFQGYTGYIQADAHTIYDALFRGTPPRGGPADASRKPPPIEVGCWSHNRRKFWEAAVCKHAEGLEGLRRINAIFAADRLLSDLPPSLRKARRDVLVRPLVDAFFDWVKAQRAGPLERGLVATALGYAANQEGPLRRFLEDGRLAMTNNSSERALRPIAAGRKAWLFFGSDDHASAAANLFSLVASCKLHALDPEAYLTDVIRVMPYWPRERYLELCPKYWARTRARLVLAELERPLGPITVPPALGAEEQSATG